MWQEESGIDTLRTILLSDVGVLPTHRANLQGSPSTCSVTPSSDVLKKINTQSEDEARGICKTFNKQQNVDGLKLFSHILVF